MKNIFFFVLLLSLSTAMYARVSIRDLEQVDIVASGDVFGIYQATIYRSTSEIREMFSGKILTLPHNDKNTISVALPHGFLGLSLGFTGYTGILHFLFTNNKVSAVMFQTDGGTTTDNDSSRNLERRLFLTNAMSESCKQYYSGPAAGAAIKNLEDAEFFWIKTEKTFCNTKITRKNGFVFIEFYK